MTHTASYVSVYLARSGQHFYLLSRIADRSNDDPSAHTLWVLDRMDGSLETFSVTSLTAASDGSTVISTTSELWIDAKPAHEVSTVYSGSGKGVVVEWCDPERDVIVKYGNGIPSIAPMSYHVPTSMLAGEVTRVIGRHDGSSGEFYRFDGQCWQRYLADLQRVGTNLTFMVATELSGTDETTEVPRMLVHTLQRDLELAADAPQTTHAHWLNAMRLRRTMLQLTQCRMTNEATEMVFS